MDDRRPHLNRRALNERLDWNLLRTFLVIGQERSISRAAARLHLTQPAISQALKRLEEQLGTPLIARRGPRFDITEAGEEALRIAEEINANVSRLGIAMDEHPEQVLGKVRLLCISRIESAAYDEFLSAFHKRHPRVELEVEVMRSADIISALQQQTASLGLSLCRVPVAKLERIRVMRQRYAFFCGRHHQLFGRDDLTLDDLKGEHFVSFSSDQIGGSLSPLTIFRDQQGFAGRIVASSPSLEEIRRLVHCGFGVGCLPEHIVRDDLAAGRLWRLPPAEGIADVDIHLLWNREQKHSVAERTFLDELRQHLERVPLEQRLSAG
ncbi:LysR family transcriptional regulator [Metapseudomonas furukawaii]|uniref:Cys regulon transcriptional activator CysB n=1 Tax=Metapseudomonas furukawaii TaxID=1149133 RepID=A0AAD1FEC1_METFU|nr:LysR family transcriptional regulator [Pseudomonas furukawaii]ELS24912.1 Cys regulon transcriptional activator CysB [Pseudomonas furukawaii]BAU72807.1 Cys regulon transcriptional activator CysB [Pseudomonas furukawaii]